MEPLANRPLRLGDSTFVPGGTGGAFNAGAQEFSPAISTAEAASEYREFVPQSYAVQEHHQVHHVPEQQHHWPQAPAYYDHSIPLPVQHASTAPTPLPNPERSHISQFFVAPDLRLSLLRRAALRYAVPDPATNPEASIIPASVSTFHSLNPLDSVPLPPNSLILSPTSAHYSHIFHQATRVYAATSSISAERLAIRRIDHLKVTHLSQLSALDPWKSLRHPNVVRVHSAFATKAFGGGSALCVVHAYEEGSVTLREAYCGGTGVVGVKEDVVWSVLCQLVSAVKAVHAAGLAVRVVRPSKVLLTSENRVKLGSCGVMDVIEAVAGEQPKTPAQMKVLQEEDVHDIAHTVISVALGTARAIENISASLNVIGQQFGAELRAVLSHMYNVTSIDEILPALAPRLLLEADRERDRSDYVESELAKELENGRLFRVASMLAFVNERPAGPRGADNASWSETGDRYLLKLFRDFVFHQEYADGRPVLDLGHVVSALNKLDLGSRESVNLMSRDGNNLLVVSYADVKKCLMDALSELAKERTHNLH